MSALTVSSHRRRWSRYLVLIGLALITVLVWHFGYGRLLGLIRGAAPAPLLLMALLILGGFWIRAWKWHYALGPGQQGVLLFFLAKTAGNWTPGRAGELAPLLLKHHRNARVAAWIGLDRVVEVSWTVGLGVLGAVALGALTLTAAGVLLGAGCLLAGGLWAWSRRAGAGDRVIPMREEGMEPSKGREDGSLAVRAGLYAKLRRFGRRVRVELVLFGRKMPLIMVLTAIAKFTDVYAVILLCDAFGYGVSFLLVCAARCAHGIVSALPVTPDATGVPFVAAAWLLHENAAIPYDTLTAALGLEVVVINAILWVCFCLVSGTRWMKTA